MVNVTAFSAAQKVTGFVAEYLATHPAPSLAE